MATYSLMRRTNTVIDNLYITPNGCIYNCKNPVEKFDALNVSIILFDNVSHVMYNINNITLSQCMTLYSLFCKKDIDTAMYFMNLK